MNVQPRRTCRSCRLVAAKDAKGAKRIAVQRGERGRDEFSRVERVEEDAKV